uniref:Receptor-like serine/threonine-protein kinase n=1 Tax=Tanacetum cinerariifolium TaxID=118510 RepID=A0A6L2NZ07_TANCI|nr:putative receptor protein kinase ZmPK1 [Tanacetum cinerariifolium]
MAAQFHVLLFTILILSLSSSISSFDYVLTRRSSLYVENKDELLVSPNGLFIAGFHQVGDNAYCFAIWFSEQVISGDRTVVWMASRDEPVNGKRSKLSLREDGNLVLVDAGRSVIWATHTKSSSSSLRLQLYETGNLVLQEGEHPIWQSFDYPTDTLLPNQLFTENTALASSSSDTFSSDSRIVSLDSHGQFNSSDGFDFTSADFGMGPQRIMKLGSSKCTCLHGHKMVNPTDWSYGCEPEFKPCTHDDCDFIELSNVEFFSYDNGVLREYNQDSCKKSCLHDRTCRGFQFGWKADQDVFYCFMKRSFHNGYKMGFDYTMYIKLPKTLVSSFDQNITIPSSLSCPRPVVRPIIRAFEEKHNDVKQYGVILEFGCMIGFIEIACIVIFWYYTSKHSSNTEPLYHPTATGFRRFTYSELKKASCNFSEEIGRGGACVVYKGKLSDNRIAAIKSLKNTNHQGEAEFQSEISIIGRVNHMNLIEMWGYCAEGKHRLVVYEYMENGSLALNMELAKLDWATMFKIATGTAKGLAYLHEECLEWVLHCDVKPHNILLDSNYNPKVADFGLCKVLDRHCTDEWNFSMMRGTRGYMAPEWAFNLPITSKVDVFSYGVVILEMITGRSALYQTSGESCKSGLGLVNWVRDSIYESDGSCTDSWVDKIVDPSITGEYEQKNMKKLVRIALQCTEEDSGARPSMSQVVDMLIHLN